MRSLSCALGLSIGAIFLAGSGEVAWAVGTPGLSSPTNGGWVASVPTLRWTAASSATSYTLTITPSVGSPLVKAGLTGTSYTLTANEALTTAGGPYVWRVTAYDAANASADSSTWSFFVDTTPPDTFTLTSPEANAWTRESEAYVSWVAPTDTGSGIGAYHVYVDGILCSSPAGTAVSGELYHSACSPGEGSHYWSVSVEDNVGNLTWCSECANGVGGRAFRIDNTGPADPSITGGTFHIGSANEPDFYGSTTDRMVDTGLTILPGESVSISAAGDWCPLGCSSSIGCTTVSGSSSSSAVVPASNCTPFSLIARIGGTFYCVGANATINSTTSGKLYLGSNSKYTGCSTPTVTATVTGGHSFDLIEPADGAVLANSSPLFTWKPATDSGSGGVNYWLSVDPNIPNTVGDFIAASQTSATLPTPLTDGVYKWDVSARDAVGNNTVSIQRWFTIDTARPDQFRLSKPDEGSCTSVPTPALSWDTGKDASGVATHQVYIDNVLAITTTGSFATPTAALSQGQHTWYVVEADRAGNWRQSSDTRKFWVDYTPPSAPTLSAPANGASLVDPPIFSWAAATDNVGIASYALYVDGTLTDTLGADTLSYLSHTDLSLGSHTWYVRALDRCGQGASAAAGTFTMLACTPDGAQHPCPGYNIEPCRPGTRTCTAAGTWSSCADAVGPASETCNGIDDNCDGIIDNSTAIGTDNQCGGICTVIPPYIWTECDGPDLDSCKEGHIACDGLNATVCVETTPNNVEICNGRDDDCNGVVDDGCSPVGTGGATSTGGTSANSGGSAGTTSIVAGGTGGLTANLGGNAGHGAIGGLANANTSGGQAVTSGGNNGTLVSTTAVTSVGGIGTNAGGAGVSTGGIGVNAGGAGVSTGGIGVNAGGTSGIGTGAGGANTGAGGVSVVALGGASAASSNTLSVGGATDSAGGTSVGLAGGTNAIATASIGASAGMSASTHSGTAVASDAGPDAGSENSDSGCGCRVSPRNNSYRQWALLCAFGLLLLGRRRARLQALIFHGRTDALQARFRRGGGNRR